MYVVLVEAIAILPLRNLWEVEIGLIDRFKRLVGLVEILAIWPLRCYVQYMGCQNTT